MIFNFDRKPKFSFSRKTWFCFFVWKSQFCNYDRKTWFCHFHKVVFAIFDKIADFPVFGGKPCFLVLTKPDFTFSQKNVTIRFWWKFDIFKFWRVTWFCDTGEKNHFCDFGTKIHFSVFAGKLNFPVLVENFGFYFGRKTCFCGFSKKPHFLILPRKLIFGLAGKSHLQFCQKNSILWFF